MASETTGKSICLSTPLGAISRDKRRAYSIPAGETLRIKGQADGDRFVLAEWNKDEMLIFTQDFLRATVER